MVPWSKVWGREEEDSECYVDDIEDSRGRHEVVEGPLGGGGQAGGRAGKNIAAKGLLKAK